MQQDFLFRMWKEQPSDDQDMMQNFWPICTEMSGDSTKESKKSHISSLFQGL